MADGRGGYREGAFAPLSPDREAARLDLEQEKARHERIKADRAQLELDIALGNHLPREVTAAAAATAMAAFVQTMRSLGPNLERSLGLSPAVAEAIEIAVDQALSTLGEQLEAMTRLPGGAGHA